MYKKTKSVVVSLYFEEKQKYVEHAYLRPIINPLIDGIKKKKYITSVIV